MDVNNYTIITPNRRLASALKAQIEAQQTDICFVTPVVLPVNVWIQELWNIYSRQTFTTLPHLLNSTQEQVLWESIIRNSSWQEYLLQVTETARLVKSAYSLLKQWRVNTADPLFESANDYAACKYWIETFQHYCETNQWLDSASLPDFLMAKIAAGELTLPQNIYHAGFTELTPQIQALLNLAATQGSQVANYELPCISSQIVRTEANNADDEIIAAARWAMELYKEHPQARIACVFPGLDKQRERIRQLFIEVTGNNELFNLSAGRPLAEYPVIRAALRLLGMSGKQYNIEQIYFLLSTPFIAGGESEYLRRSQLDQWRRSRNYSVISNSNLENSPLSRCPLLFHRLKSFKALLEQTEAKPFAHWALQFNELLATLGWPGERILNSEEYQVVSEWLALLQEFTTLDVTEPPVKYYQALQYLTQLAHNKPFQAKTPATRIQILGVLEAAGLNFDYLWVSGLDDNTWPAQPKPNPFIPKRLQRELNMPHASAERELTYCQTVLKQFTQSAPQVVLSHAAVQDETPLQASPLIRHYSFYPLSSLIHAHQARFSEQIYANRQIELVIDNQAPPLISGETVKGGVSVLKLQAQCPFKAFAQCRLSAHELEEPLPGLRPKERGTIIHYIMEKCWEYLQSRDKLLTLDDESLQSVLTSIIDEALQQHAHAQQHQSGYLRVEKQRLHKLVSNWLNIEKERPAFQVLSHEKNVSLTLGELNINMRIDRIDQLADGRKLIIDYKTGKYLSVQEWLGPRPDEPQLPLYAILDKTNTAGLAYAKITANNPGFIGLSDGQLDIKGVNPSTALRSSEELTWQKLNTDWQSHLDSLSQDFCQGKAYIDPKEAEKTCQHCALKALCRIQDETLL